MAHTVERVFLGWDQPALPAAAARLIDHYIQGPVADLRPASIVLPGRRARRRLIELLLDEAGKRGATLIPPRAITVGSLPDLLHSPTKPLADEVTARRAWSRALRSVDRETLGKVFPHLPGRNSPTAWDELATLLAGLHQNLAREGHTFGAVVKVCRSGLLFDDGGRWEILASVQRRYFQLLDRSGMADPFETRIVAVRSGVAPFTGDLWLVSIVEMPYVTRRLVEASGASVHSLIHAPAEHRDGTYATDAYDALGLPMTDYWKSAPVPVTDDILTVVERPVDQAEAVIDGLARLGGRYSAEEVVLAVHRDSEVVPYLEQRLAARDVSSRYAAGTPLSRTAPVRLLLAIADYLGDRTFQSLAALLRHPDAGPLTGSTSAAAAGIESIEVADRYFRDHLPFRIRGEIPRGQGRAALFPPLVRALEWEGPLVPLGDRRVLSEWMPVVMDILSKTYGALELDRKKPAHRRLLDTLGRIQGVAASLAAIPAPLDEECLGGEAIRVLLSGLREEALPPEPNRDAVELVDWLELPLDDAPFAMVTGFNEGFLPESVSGHAFLPDALRTRLGLPDNRSRLARDAYRLTTVLHSKASVRIIAGRRTTQGDPLRPSRLMFRIPEARLPERVLHFLKGEDGGAEGSSLASLGLRPREESRFTVPPEPVIALGEDEVPTSLAVTAFGAFLNDPYRFVLERVYRLRSEDDTARELDPMIFGNLAHNVLHRFGLVARDSLSAIELSDQAIVARTFDAVLEEEVSTRFGADALPAVYLQVEQLRARLRAFAGRQAEWAARGWRIVAVECEPEGDGVPFDVDGTPILLRGRVDRIDHNPSIGQWAVLDYKTGAVVEPPEQAHRRIRGDDRNWVDLQLPLYRRLLPGIVDEDGRPIVDTDVVEDRDIRLGYIALPKETEKTDFMLAHWTEEDLASAEATARDVVRRLRSGRFEFDPGVTRVGRFGDSLEPLLKVGWQASGVEDDVGELEGPTTNAGRTKRGDR